jgi:hypothetical protein
LKRRIVVVYKPLAIWGDCEGLPKIRSLLPIEGGGFPSLEIEKLNRVFAVRNTEVDALRP